MTWFISVWGQRDRLDRQHHLNEDLRLPKIETDGMLKKENICWSWNNPTYKSFHKASDALTSHLLYTE